MTRRESKPGTAFRTKPLRPHVTDSYRSRTKPQEPTVCRECSAVFHAGRWQWLPAPESAERVTCPACHRIRDKAPAGYVKLEGKFFVQHRDELLALVQNVERRERAEHALQRIMNISDEAHGVLITTTDAHLARAIGEAVSHAYDGTLDVRYNDDENLARIHWTR